MSNSVFSPAPEGTQPSSTSLLERMRQRLHGFTVIDRSGVAVGEVQDLQPDPEQPQRHFYVIVQPQRQWLHSRQLGRIDIASRSLFTKLSAAEVKQLPDRRQAEPLPQAVSAPSSAAIVPDGEEIVQLLEERLLVSRDKRKVGEVIVRKAVETRMVQVPVRREKLIVEQVGQAGTLAEIDLGKGQVVGIDLASATAKAAGEATVAGEFGSLEDVLQLLEAIARTVRHRCTQINVELLLQDRDSPKTHHQFSSPALAIQLLRAIAPVVAHRCQRLHLELVLADRDIQQTYQQWFDSYRSR